MTEQVWQTCADPTPMLEFLRTTGMASDRQLRFFAVACSRRVWTLMDDLGRAAVEVAELFADGVVGPEVLRAARLACKSAGDNAAWYAAATNPAIAARNASLSALSGQDACVEREAQAAMLRCIIGNPFQPSRINPLVLARCDGAVVKFAQTVYDERAFDRMPALAYALEAAGCDNAVLLAHLRSDGLHVRGCWCVDLVLEKK
jgi:hypothetical protein